jgi:hypothetical protein
MGDPTDLNELAHDLLDVAIDALDTLPAFGLEGAPERSFVSPGQPVLDCCLGTYNGQLTVHAAGVNDAQTTPGGLDAGRRIVRGKINHTLFLVTIARCIPVATDDGNPPPVEDLEAAAAQTNADAWALWNVLFNLAEDFSTLCGEVFFDGFRPLPPSNCAGWVGAIRVRLDGYQSS